MATMLRFAKCCRLLPAFGRSLVFKSYCENNTNFIRFRPVLSTTLTQRFTSTLLQSNQHLEQSLQKLDYDARRFGRLKLRHIEEVLEQIRHSKSASSSQSLLLIRCCGSLVPEELPEHRTSLVQKVWQTLHKLNIPCDISHFNAMLRVYLENEHSFRPTEFLADMESKGVEPNRVTYQRLITQYCREGDILGATKMLESMRAKELSINEHIFNALITGHSEADDIESAVGILSVMKQAGLEPTADTYTHLLCAYAKHSKLNEILPTLDKCEANEIYLTDIDLFEIIYKLATNGHSDFVGNILPRLRKSSGYNQDAVNVILRLVNNGQEDVAFEILKTMPRATKSTGELSDTGAFFLRQLIKSKRPAEKIISFCRELEREGLNNKATIFAVEVAARSGNLDIAVPLFRELQQNELPVRQHYFWPLICARTKIGNNDAILDVLRVMQSEFGMTVNGETVRDYVVPNLQEQSCEDAISLLRTAGVSAPVAVTSCIYHALAHARIKEAADAASSFKIYYQPTLLKRSLVTSLRATNDYRSWCSIVRSVYENLPRLQNIQNAAAAVAAANNEQPSDGNETQKQSEVVGQFVVDVVIHIGERKVEVTQNVLSALVEEGLPMSKRHAEIVLERLGSLLTPEISTLLDKLTAGELKLVPYESRMRRLKDTNISPQNLEKFVRQREAEGEATNGLQHALLQAHLKANDVQKTEELLDKLSQSDFVLTSGLYSKLIEMYCDSNDLDKALAVHSQIKSKEPDYVLDHLKTLKIINEFVAHDRIDEAVVFIKSNKRTEKLNDELYFPIDSLCFRILNSLAEKGRDADLDKIFNALEENNFMNVTNVQLGPLVKVHLVNNDIAKAVAAFKVISTKYKCTPLKNELSCKLIQAEDATNLQLVTDLSTSIHGEHNSLYDMALSFVECGRVRQARKILESPGLQSRPQRFTRICERYYHDGKSGSIEALAEATRGLNKINRHEIFDYLLLCYCKEDSAEKALDLWTRMQEEDDVVPTDKFLSSLARFLTEKGVNVPFAVPATEDSEVNPSDRRINRDSGSNMKALRKVGKLTEAKENVNSDTKLNVVNGTNRLKRLIQKNQLDGATQHISMMLEADIYPRPKIFCSYLDKLVYNGNYEAIEQLSPRLTPEIRRKVSFDNRLGQAYLSAGKSELFLDQVIQNCNNATTEEELKDLENNFPMGATIKTLDQHPELFAKFEEFAESMAQKGLHAPINIMWMIHIANGKLDAADRIMRNYLREWPNIVFSHVLRVARHRKDETIALNVLKALADTKVSERGTVHSCVIDVYCLQQKYDEAMKAVDNAINDVCLENINRTALIKVKKGLEASGKTFAHTIPDRKKKVADSSSSSDDDEPIKK